MVRGSESNEERSREDPSDTLSSESRTILGSHRPHHSTEGTHIYAYTTLLSPASETRTACQVEGAEC